MAVSFSYDSENRVLIGKISGSPTLEELTGSVGNLIESQEYPPDVNTLWDLREMEFYNIDYKFGEQLIEFRKSIAVKRGGAKLALLSINDLAKPLLELYRIMSESLLQQVAVFTRYEEAMTWLCEKTE